MDKNIAASEWNFHPMTATNLIFLPPLPILPPLPYIQEPLWLPFPNAAEFLNPTIVEPASNSKQEDVDQVRSAGRGKWSEKED
jgi:hypothetical protein